MFKEKHFSSRLITIILCFILGIIVLIVFSPVLGSQFLFYDDNSHIVNNPAVHSLSPKGLFFIFTQTIHDTYIPLTTLSFALEYYFWGNNSFIVHLDNLLLHVAVVLIIFRFAQRLGIPLWASFWGALLFGIHPMHVESVAWATERKDVLYSFFYMLGLMTYISYVRNNNFGWYVYSLILGFLSILAKPMAISFPLFLLSLDWFLERKFTKKIWLEKLMAGLVIWPVALLTYVHFVRVPGYDRLSSFLTWMWTFKFYLWKFICPWPLSALYLLPKPVALLTLPYTLTIVFSMVFLVSIFIFYKNRWFIFAFGSFLISIFFLFRFDDKVDVNIVADRFMYLPSIGICLGAGILIFRALSFPRNHLFFKLAVGMVALIFSGLAILSFRQTKIWKNDQILSAFLLKNCPDHFSTNLYNGEVQYIRNDYQSAEKFFNRAIEIRPLASEGYYWMGAVKFHLHDTESALRNLNRAIIISPEHDDAHVRRGIVYRELQKYPLAISDFNKALEIRPRSVGAFINRANTYMLMSMTKEAMADYESAITLDPKYANAYNNRGVAYLNTGKFDMALADFSRAKKIDPLYDQVYYNEANAYLKTGKEDLALEDYNKALELNSSYWQARMNRANLYEKRGEKDRAIAEYDIILANDPQNMLAQKRRSEIAFSLNGKALKH